MLNYTMTITLLTKMQLDLNNNDKTCNNYLITNIYQTIYMVIQLSFAIKETTQKYYL